MSIERPSELIGQLVVEGNLSKGTVKGQRGRGQQQREGNIGNEKGAAAAAQQG